MIATLLTLTLTHTFVQPFDYSEKGWQYDLDKTFGVKISPNGDLEKVTDDHHFGYSRRKVTFGMPMTAFAAKDSVLNAGGGLEGTSHEAEDWIWSGQIRLNRDQEWQVLSEPIYRNRRSDNRLVESSHSIFASYSAHQVGTVPVYPVSMEVDEREVIQNSRGQREERSHHVRKESVGFKYVWLLPGETFNRKTGTVEKADQTK